MAEDCITVTFEDGNTWDYCWEDGMAEPNWSAEDVTSGLRKSRSPTARSWRICQYYVKGMSAICSHWVEDSDSAYGGKCDAGTGSETPSGYNNGLCDFLGRRHWCSHYSPSVPDNLDEYICVAPNMFLSGLSKDNNSVPISDIGGYNASEDDLTSPGRCDCYGMGRGARGCSIVGELVDEGGSDKIEKELNKLPPICEYYRPYQMSFGSHDNVFGDERLPLNYIIYNYMAEFQKCQWWDQDSGSTFNMNTGQVVLDDDEGFDGSGRIVTCICENALADPYNTRTAESESGDEHYMAHGGFLLENVWAKAGGHVCNGARPDCPCYTGKWNFLTEEKMFSGMPVTANQVFELRFWSYDWHTQEEYDAYFLQRPNTEDPETASIFTFTKWESLGTHPSDSIMIGKELSMCQPAPLNKKEFIPEKYIEVQSPIRYAPMQVEKGTRPVEDNYFTSLIRSPRYPSARPFLIIYPYQSDAGAFSEEVCVESADDGHNKYHHTVNDDEISVIGFTVRAKNVFCINQTYMEHRTNSFIFTNDKIKSTVLLPPAQRQEAFDAISTLVSMGMENEPEWISYASSDSQQGYFVMPPLKLKYGDNDLFMCVDFNDGTWEFSKVKVKNTWCGGVVHQTSYKHQFSGEDDGARNTQPIRISPPASIEATATPLGGSYSTSLEAVYTEVSADGACKYSYSIIENEIEEEKDIDKWCSVGNSSSVFAEIEDINLNYIFNWKLLSATMTPKEEYDSDGNPSVIRKDATEVEMEVIDIDQNSIIPNCCVLIPKNVNKDRVSFMNSEWSLKIKYSYETFDPTGQAPGKKIAGAGSGPNAIYKAPPVSIETTGHKALIEDIETGPIGVIAFFTNKSDRITSVMASRMYVCITDVRCRNVDIYYKYFTEGTENVLIPKSGFCIEVDGAEATGEVNRYAYHPACGDHELGYKWEGPMWYPFNACRGFDLYDVFTICNYCTASFQGPNNDAVVGALDYSEFFGIGDVIHRKDFRYCGPAEFYARGEVRGASACSCGCSFYYTGPLTDFEWKGVGKIKTRFTLIGYEGAHPPFGNDGCEVSEKYLSRDYVQHKDLYGVVRQEWMPVVMDHHSFYFSFNAFDGGNEREEHSFSGPSTTDPFIYVDQLSLFTLNNINEQMIQYDEEGLPTSDRRSFDELFKIHHEGNCSYPPPVLEPNHVIFYDFKDKDVAWAWQEKWRDVERIPTSESSGGDETVRFNSLGFILKYDKPRYVYGLYKDEHRLICGEGISTIKYTGPKVEDGELTVYPTISLDGGVPRPFEIIYDNYDSTQVIWKNNPDVGGSSGGDTSIYEKTTGGNWLHEEDHDTIFDDEASSSEDDDRCVVVALSFGEEVKKYYNRGIDVKIPRNRLTYLPMEEQEYELEKGSGEYVLYFDVEVTEELTPNSTLPVNFIWDKPVFITTGDVINESGFVITGLKISGLWGYSTVSDENMCWVKPGVRIGGTTVEGSPVGGIVNTQKEYPYFDNGLETYTINCNILPTPKDMIDDRLGGFTIELTGDYGMIIGIHSITLSISTKYKDSELFEEIDVWERKYLPSLFSKGNEQINLDGPGDHMSYHLDLWNAGVYYPFSNEVDPVEAADKMRSAYSNGRYMEDETLDISIGNLHDIEAEEQMKLYKEAYNLDSEDDSLTFQYVIPPTLSDYHSSRYHGAGTCSFIFERIQWEDHYLVKEFEQFDFWQPGGHFYQWSKDVTIEKCMVFGMAGMKVHSGSFNHYKHTGESSTVAADLFNAYYNVRPRAILAKYNRWIILTGEPPAGGGDLLTQANPYAVGLGPGAWTQ